MIYFYSTSQLKQLSQVKWPANSMAKVEVPLSSEVRTQDLRFLDEYSSITRCFSTYIITHFYICQLPIQYSNVQYIHMDTLESYSSSLGG